MTIVKLNIGQALVGVLVVALALVLTGDQQTDKVQILFSEVFIGWSLLIIQIILSSFLKRDFDRMLTSNQALRRFSQVYAASVGVFICEFGELVVSGGIIPIYIVSDLLTQSALEYWLITVFSILFAIQGLMIWRLGFLYMKRVAKSWLVVWPDNQRVKHFDAWINPVKGEN
ncbi:MAG: hypothetical protein LKJ69_04765 [Lactobacillus sp.]|jgi:hypothetical protein|nr:hypothetical protein [Lactobacillus sp.]MCI2032695.1 hypothetical protein [Lactobacillus sp.]